MSERPSSKHEEPSRSKFPEQNADGVDLSLIRANLELTPTERIRRANRFQKNLMWLRKNARRVTQE